jgi:hypothetical protein
MQSSGKTQNHARKRQRKNLSISKPKPGIARRLGKLINGGTYPTCSTTNTNVRKYFLSCQGFSENSYVEILDARCTRSALQKGAKQ